MGDDKSNDGQKKNINIEYVGTKTICDKFGVKVRV